MKGWILTNKKYPQALLWLDFETDNLPNGMDYSNVNILEVGAVVTDFDLQKFKGVHEVRRLNSDIVQNLKANKVILDMHTKSGLLQDMAKEEDTHENLSTMEDSLIELLKDCTFDKQEYILAGSGVATFDMPLIQLKMPRLAEWLQYYTLDIGVLRRTVYYLSARRQFVPETRNSYADGFKKHRALDDALAHIDEAVNYKDWLRGLP